MFCSKCGKEIMDEAVVCPNCGCATNNYNSQQQQPVHTTVNTYSDDYLTIKQFSEQARILRNLGIFAAVLMFGIGIIFSIIIWVKLSKNKIPEITTTNPAEIAEFETAKRRYKLAYQLSGLPIIALALCFAIGCFIGMFSVM